MSAGGVQGAVRVRCRGAGDLVVREVYADFSKVADGRGQKGERCQRQLCAQKAVQLAAERKAHTATRRELETERRTRATLVRGEVRAALVGREAEVQQIEILRREAKIMLTDRNRFERRALLLKEEVSQLIEAGARLAADLAQATRELKTKAKEAATSARRANGQLQGARRQTAAAVKRTEAAQAQAVEATGQWAEAEGRVEELQAAVLESEQRAEEAQLEAGTGGP